MFDSTFFLVIAIIAIVLQGFLLFLALFQPALKYKVPRSALPELDSPEFLRALSILCDAQVHQQTKAEVLTNGDQFYEAELEAIRGARHSIDLEAYIFQKGQVARKFIDALSERARAGVQVNIVLDAIGSFASWNRYFRELRESGGRVGMVPPTQLAHMAEDQQQDASRVDHRGRGSWICGRRGLRRSLVDQPSQTSTLARLHV